MHTYDAYICATYMYIMHTYDAYICATYMYIMRSTYIPPRGIYICICILCIRIVHMYIPSIHMDGMTYGYIRGHMDIRVLMHYTVYILSQERRSVSLCICIFLLCICIFLSCICKLWNASNTRISNRMNVISNTMNLECAL